METYDLNSWHDFQPLIVTIQDRFQAAYPLLFRGQADSDWKLSTTLERATTQPTSVPDYLFIARKIANEVESTTGKRWDVSEFPEIHDNILKKQTPHVPHFPHYNFLVHMRHHGFPSPLLDWSESAYIAAYFAAFEATSADRMAVYAFVDAPNRVKVNLNPGSETVINCLGPHVVTHPRHVTQKAWYTVATMWEPPLQRHVFRPHAEAFNGDGGKQDVLIKITLPAKLRPQILKSLNEYNLNHFTLFGTEDGLMKALAIREYVQTQR